MFIQKRLVLLPVMIMLLLLAACGGDTQEPTATPVPPTATPVPPTATPEPTDTPAPTPTSAEAPTAEEEPEEEPQSTTIEGLTENAFALPGVESYRSRTTISVSGPAFEAEGEDAEESMAALMQGFEIEGEHTQNPTAHHVTVRMGGEVFAETIQIEDKAWAKSAFMGDTWTETEASDTDELTSGFAGDLGEVFSVSELEEFLGKLERVGTEEVNGIQTVHYSADKEVMRGIIDESDPDALAEFENADLVQMDFYITKEGVLVKWEMHIEGTGLNEENPEASGTMTFTSELYDFNADITIEPPETPSASETMGFDLPMPEGASQSFSIQGMTTLEVPDATIQELVEFYVQGMTGIGFQHDEENSFTSAEFATLTFTQNDTEVTIAISPGDSPDAPLQVIVQSSGADSDQ